MSQNVTTMDDTVAEVIINAAKTVNILEQLVKQRRWRSVLAHLQTKQGCEDARKRDSWTGKTCTTIVNFINKHDSMSLKPL